MTGLEGALIVAGVNAAANLLGGLFTGSAQREAERRSAKQAALGGAMQMQQGLYSQQQKATESALGDLISAYRSTLGG